MGIITLLTDFGLEDEYVGVLKGVILDTNPSARIVDISHGIEPQDIVAAAHALKAAYPYFPDGTVHAIVVDPGVGTRRSILAAQIGSHRFVAPDNGLLTDILKDCDTPDVIRVTNEKLFKHPVSRTFHGRDIIAPVAAQLLAGFPLLDIGPAVALDDIYVLEGMVAKWISPGLLEGRIISIDHFGNLMTNIHARDLADNEKDQLMVVAGEIQTSGLRDTYADGAAGEPIAIWSSRNTIEIAVNEGSAAQILGLAKGAVVRVTTGKG